MNASRSLLACAAAAVMLIPVAGRAQLVISAGVASSGPTQDSTKGPTVVSADSLANLKKFVKNNRPIVIIDGIVKPAAQFNKVKVTEIATVELKMEEDTSYYGAQAKNGVLVITLKPAPPPEPKPAPAEKKKKKKSGA